MYRAAVRYLFVGHSLDRAGNPARIAEPLRRLNVGSICVEIHPALNIARRAGLNAVGLALAIISRKSLFCCLAAS
jgi:hypothetical protein